MTVSLQGVTREVDGIPADSGCLVDASERGTLSVLLGPTLSGKTSIMRLLAGLDKPTAGRVVVDGKDVTGLDVRQRRWLWSISSSSITPLHRLRKHRLAAAGAGQASRRDREAGSGGGEAAETGTVFGAHAAAIVRRPAATHSDRARAGQGRRPRLAGRAARQSRLQAARGIAHRTAAHLRGVRRDLRLCDDRALRSLAARRPHRLHVGG